MKREDVTPERRKDRLVSIVIAPHFAVALIAAGACNDSTSLGESAASLEIVGPTNIVVGQQARFDARAEDEQGNTVNTPPVSWGSSDPGIASIDQTGLVMGVAQGSVEISATAGALQAAAPLSVTGGQSLPDPRPDSNDRLLLDARECIQNANSKNEALNCIGSDRIDNLFALSTDVDGQGTQAIRVDWPQQPCSGGDIEERVIHTIVSPKPSELFIQWKQHMGRTSTGGGIGTVGGFDNTNETCSNQPNAGRKVLLTLRAGVGGGGSNRVGLLFPGPTPANAKIEINPPIDKPIFSGWDADTHVAQTHTFTLHYRADSSAGAGDGVVRVWVDGQLIINETTIEIGEQGFDRFQFPSTFFAPKFDMTEYYWDVVAWAPVP